MDADGIFSGVFKEDFKETLLIPVHTVPSSNYREIINKRLHRYLNKAQKINSVEKFSLHQWLQGVFFAFYAWNVGPVDGTYIAQSVVDIRRELPFQIYLSPEMSREGNSEGHQALEHFEAASPLMFRQREIFNILVSERRPRQREL